MLLFIYFFLHLFANNRCAIGRIRGAGATTPSFDSAPVHVETWDDLVNVGKQKKTAKYVHNACVLRNSDTSYVLAQCSLSVFKRSFINWCLFTL